MADYGLKIFGADGSLWLDHNDLMCRLVTSIPVNIRDSEKWVSVAGITPDNASIIIAPGTFTFSGGSPSPFYPTYAAIANGGVRVSATGGLLDNSSSATAQSARVLVFMVR